MNAEWIITGIILLGAMLAGGIYLYIRRRKEANLSASLTDLDK
jgi:LPXTG-motif cell wall-anchored protein